MDLIQVKHEAVPGFQSEYTLFQNYLDSRDYS